jgi:nanoRNase/pAp phosphatase (c-di-AMP/oligoRNAs hydrolase)
MLKEVIEALNPNNRIFIQTHKSPDPDAIGSAVLLSKLLSENGINSQVIFSGEMDRSETIDLAQDTDVKLIQYDKYGHSLDMTKKDQVILVDCQAMNGNVLTTPGSYIAVIDHHPKNNNFAYAYEDIRSDYGACCSILYEYAVAVGSEIKPQLASLLLHGIRVDTDTLFGGEFYKDVNAFAELYKIADLPKLRLAGMSRLSEKDMLALKRAMGSIIVDDRVGYCNAGEGLTKSAIAVIADYLITLSVIDFIVVYSMGIAGVLFSVRSLNTMLDAGEIIKECLSKYGGTGGGHSSKAGGSLPSRQIGIVSEEELMQYVTRIFGEAINVQNTIANISSPGRNFNNT